MEVGFIGLGVMGRSMARHVLDADGDSIMRRFSSIHTDVGLRCRMGTTAWLPPSLVTMHRR